MQGGIGSLDDCVEVLKLIGVSGIAMGRMLQFSDANLIKIRRHVYNWFAIAPLVIYQRSSQNNKKAMEDSLTPQQYSSDPFTRSFGVDRIRALDSKYGSRYREYRADWERAGETWLPDFPLNVVFDLVDKCNLACPQCLRAPDLIKITRVL